MTNKRYIKKEEKLLQIYDSVLPPNAEDIEKTVLGTILIEGEAIHRIASELKPNLFFNVQCQKTCEVILHLYNNNKPIDIITVSQSARSLGLSNEASPSWLKKVEINRFQKKFLTQKK